MPLPRLRAGSERRNHVTAARSYTTLHSQAAGESVTELLEQPASRLTPGIVPMLPSAHSNLPAACLRTAAESKQSPKEHADEWVAGLTPWHP